MTLDRLSYCERRPPIGLFVLAKYKQTAFDLTAVQKDQEPTLTLASGEVLTGKDVLKHVASIGQGRPFSPPPDAHEVDQWIDYAHQYLKKDYDAKDICRRLNGHLSLRMFLLGSIMTLADLVVWGQLKTLRLETSDYAHIHRWSRFLESDAEFQTVIEEWLPKKPLNSTLTDSKKSGTSHRISSSLPLLDTSPMRLDLPNAKMGHVVTRFAPEPSGYLHIGHAKAVLLSDFIAKQYNGRIIVRFDDTNPSKEKDEFVENILKDLSDLGVTGDRLTYTSDYFDPLIQMATRLIEAGRVYADDTPVEIMRQERMDGIESKCRDKSVEENLRAWNQMQRGEDEGNGDGSMVSKKKKQKEDAKGDAFCLRIKLDMTAANKALRDPVIYRCNASSHWRTGMRYRVYPTYDFACPFVDAVEGITHALRSSEYKDRFQESYMGLSSD